MLLTELKCDPERMKYLISIQIVVFTDLNNLHMSGDLLVDPADSPGLDPEEDLGVHPDEEEGRHGHRCHEGME